MRGHKLQSLLDHPAVQAGLAPFIVALLVSELFRRIKLSGLAVIAGFAITIYLASSFSFEPLTVPRKIIALGFLGAGLGVVLDWLRFSWLTWLLPIAAGAVTIWAMLNILQHQPPQVALLWGAACAAYVALLVWGMDRLESNAMRSSSAATALGFGTGGAALLGASALLGQFGLALGAAAAALSFILCISNRTLPTGRALTLPVALIAGLTACLAVLSAKLPWYALAILVCIPLLAHLVPLQNRSVRVQILLLSLLTLPVASAAIYVTWRSAENIPF